jgi:hypothetical protein
MIKTLTTNKFVMTKKIGDQKLLLWLLIVTKCMTIEMSPILIAFIFTLGSSI